MVINKIIVRDGGLINKLFINLLFFKYLYISNGVFNKYLNILKQSILKN